VTRGLLIRRSIADGEFAFSATWCPAGTGIETLVKVEGQRWAIEDGFETRSEAADLIRWSVQELRRIAVRLCDRLVALATGPPDCCTTLTSEKKNATVIVA
jgi:hypothetical protein